MRAKALLEAAAGYLKRHPEELVRTLRNAPSFRFGVPLDAFRWLAGQFGGQRMRDIVIEAVPPGLRISAAVEAMATPLRVSGVVHIDRVEFSSETLRLALRLRQLSIQVLDERCETPVAALIRSGALDLSRPGNLAAFMPKRPPVLVEAKDDRIVLDLMKHPKLAKNPQIGRVLGMISPLFSVRAVESESDHFDVVLQPFPEGMAQAWQTAKNSF